MGDVNAPLRLVDGKDTRGKRVEPTIRDRGLTSSRFAQVSPETVARIQAELDSGQIRDWNDLVDRMFDRDADIFASYESRLSVVSAAELLVEPGELVGDAVRDRATTDCAYWTRRWLLRMPVSQYSHESLDGVGRGLGAHEIEWAVNELGRVPVAMHWLHTRRFCYGPDWLSRICDMGGDVPYSASGYAIEPDRFVLHEPRVLPGYPRGGLLRPVLWLFVLKGWAVQFWMTGAERYAFPFAVGTLQKAATEAARERMKEILEDMHGEGVAVLDPNQGISLLETTVKDAGVWAKFIEWCDRGIAKCIQGMTDLAEPTKVGSYAAVEVRAGKTVEARVLKDERALATTWTRDLIEPAIRLNADRWPVRPETPRIRWAIAAKAAPIDALAVDTMTVDEVRERHNLTPFGGARGAQLMRDFKAGLAVVEAAAGGAS